MILEFNIPSKLVRLLKTTMGHTSPHVMVDGVLSESFGISQVLKQGDRLASVLFNIVL